MLIITIHVDAPPGQAIGIKEDLAMYLERYGDARVVSVVEERPDYRQMELFSPNPQAAQGQKIKDRQG